MLPYAQPRGREAFKRVLCYNGVPIEFKDKPTHKVHAESSKLIEIGCISVKELTKLLGGKEGAN
jgi:hypothetical protein